jgi:hypothetical protein
MLISFRAVVAGYVVVAFLSYFMGWAKCQPPLFSPSSAIAANSEDLKVALDIQGVTQIYLLSK